MAMIAIGITPTCVGKSIGTCLAGEGVRDHPHLRGEKTNEEKPAASGIGSPPLAWGKVSRLAKTTDQQGITPTCVGKRHIAYHNRHTEKDHPHLRGEKTVTVTIKRRKWGSPPLAWGKGVMRLSRALRGRITPTCVGKSNRRNGKFIIEWDHPHLRGEKRSLAAEDRLKLGSPPLAWGKANFETLDVGGYRITPTCVGKSC